VGAEQADQSIYGVPSPLQEEKTPGVGDEQKAAVLARWPHGTLVSPKRTTYCPGCASRFLFSFRHELNQFVEGRAEIIRELQQRAVTILVGETGSGKTTREPSTRVPVHLLPIHGKRYPSTFSRQVYQAGNVLRLPSRGELLRHLLQPVLPRSKGFR